MARIVTFDLNFEPHYCSPMWHARKYGFSILKDTSGSNYLGGSLYEVYPDPDTGDIFRTDDLFELLTWLEDHDDDASS